MSFRSSPEVFAASFERVRARTERVIEVVPDEHLEWRYKPGAMSPGDLIRHIAVTERFMWAENIQGRPSLYTSHGPELATGKDAVVAFFRRLHAETMDVLGSLSEEQFLGLCVTPGGREMPVWRWLGLMVEHEIHHRGQLYMMMSILGVSTPPLYGMTSERLREDART